MTGKIVWKNQNPALSYLFGTPVITSHEGRTELLLSMPDALWALDPDTGKQQWRVQSRLSGNIAPSVVAGNGMVFGFGGYPRLGAIAVKLGGNGDVTASHIAWTSRYSTYVPTPVLHEGHLYFASDTGFATCLNAEPGELVYKERLPGASETGRGGKPFYASAVLANGLVYAVSRRNGVFNFSAEPEF